jgi:hypothetical protein
VRADIPGSAGYENCHEASLETRPRAGPQASRRQGDHVSRTKSIMPRPKR